MRISKGKASIKFQRQERARGSSGSGREIHVVKTQGMGLGAVTTVGGVGKLAGLGFKAIENLPFV